MTLICYLYILPLTLTTVSITLPAPSDAYNSLSLHRASSIYGQFNKTYQLNISRTASVSIVYNQSREQVPVTNYAFSFWFSCLAYVRCSVEF